jgi:malate dehydrogenase (oxaloacetate-decarboxylating)(NADP+)
VLRARQVVVDERLARPILVGRPEAIAARIKELGPPHPARPRRRGRRLRRRGGRRAGRRGVLPPRPPRGLERDFAAAEVRRNGTLIAATLLRQGRADGMLCGTFGPYRTHLRHVADVIGLRPG